jgi:protein-tyrosine-phosphatase
MESISSAGDIPDFLKVLAHRLRWKILTLLAHSDRTVTEIVRFLEEPQNVVSYHLRKLREQHIVSERRSSADSRDIYYSLDFASFRSRYLATGEMVLPYLSRVQERQDVPVVLTRAIPLRVLILCTKNSARSQMAEGLLRHISNGTVEVMSAGSQPDQLHPYAQKALLAMGIDISQQQSKHVDMFLAGSFDAIVTVCDRMREACPTFPGNPDLIHWSIPDPVEVRGTDEERYEAFVQTAQQLATRVRYLLAWIERESH